MRKARFIIRMIEIALSCILLLTGVSTAAADKVVVVPIGKSDPNLLPENICADVTIFGVTGTNTCSSLSSPQTVVSAGGRIWLDRNLGATQVAKFLWDSAAFGDLYQWGRSADGHQNLTSPTISTLSPTSTPDHGSFIAAANSPWDWQFPQDDNLWQGVSGINNPCPSGFRLPTIEEWTIERDSWISADSAGAFASPLKLPLGGNRNHVDGQIGSMTTSGWYWSSTVYRQDSIGYGYALVVNGSVANTDFGLRNRATGMSVRCIKD